MAFSPLENFRNFLSSRPPLVVFVVCIGMMAIAFISYAYYIKYNDVYNPDAEQKINEFLENVTKLNLCTKLSDSSWNTNHSPRNSSNLSQVLLNNAEETEDYADYQVSSFYMTVSVSFVPAESDLFPKPITKFMSKFPTSLLGVSDIYGNKSAAIEMVPSTALTLKCGKDSKVCLVEDKMCVSILVPIGVVPYARQRMRTNQCNYRELNSTGSFVAWLDISSPPQDERSKSNCESKILLKAKKLDEKLTVMLTLEKRSLVNMHLLHGSYFLFVVIVTVLLFGIITGGRERKYSKNYNHYALVNSGVPG